MIHENDLGECVKENGSYRDGENALSVKFSKEAQLCLGVAMREIGRGNDREQHGYSQSL